MPWHSATPCRSGCSPVRQCAFQEQIRIELSGLRRQLLSGYEPFQGWLSRRILQDSSDPVKTISKYRSPDQPENAASRFALLPLLIIWLIAGAIARERFQTNVQVSSQVSPELLNSNRIAARLKSTRNGRKWLWQHTLTPATQL